jgi:hypothetical protein
VSQISLGSFVRPLVHDLVRRLDGHDRDRRSAGRQPAVDRQRRPAIDACTPFLIFGDAKGEFPRMTERRAVKLPGNAAEHIEQEETDAAADRGVGAARVRQRIVRGVHAKRGANRAVYHDEWRAAAGARRAAVQTEFRRAHGLDDGYDDRHVFGQAASHERGDGDFLRGDPATPYRLDANGVVGLQFRRGQETQHTLFGGRHDGQAVGPAVPLEQLVGFECVGDLERGARDTCGAGHGLPVS